MAEEYNGEKGRFKKGNPGRPRGSGDKVTTAVKEAFARLLENKIDELEAWLDDVAEKDKEKAIRLYVEISRRFVPEKSEQVIEVFEGAKRIGFDESEG